MRKLVKKWRRVELLHKGGATNHYEHDVTSKVTHQMRFGYLTRYGCHT